jgi:hypothetical protein
LNDGSVVLIAFGVRSSGTRVSSQDNEDKGNDRNLLGFGRRFKINAFQQERGVMGFITDDITALPGIAVFT